MRVRREIASLPGLPELDSVAVRIGRPAAENLLELSQDNYHPFFSIFLCRHNKSPWLIGASACLACDSDRMPHRERRRKMWPCPMVALKTAHRKDRSPRIPVAGG